MLELKLYGTGSATSDYISKHISQTLAEAGIDFILNLENNVELFLSNKIESIPAIEFNEQVYYFNKEGLLSTNLRVLLHEILEAYNFGNMPNIYCHVEAPNPSVEAIIYAHKLATSKKAVVKLDCYIPKNIVDITSNEDYFYKLVDNIEAEWGSDIFSTAIIRADVKRGEKNNVIHNHLLNEKPFLSILPTVNEKELREYQTLASSFGTVINKLPKYYSQL
jgi:hypothetical protein